MIRRGFTFLLAAVAIGCVGAGIASAAGVTSSLFGGAVNETSDVKLVADLTDTSTTDDFSGITFTLPAGTTFADLTALSTDFNPTTGGCGGGAPRFTLHLSSGKNVFVYLGPSPNFTGCTLNQWQSSGNLIGNNDTGRYDTSQVQAGTQSNTYAGALALVGSQTVTSIDLVVDAGWFFTPKTQIVLVRNVDVNGQTFFSPSTAKMNPAQTCRSQLSSLGRAAFDAQFGTNHNQRNAFGKCVSAAAKAKH